MSPRSVVLVAALATLGASAWAALDSERGGLALLLAALAALTAGFAWHEGGTSSVKDIALVATLAGVAAAGRLLFAPVPGVQPVTVIVVVAGVALGPRRGFAVGALAALASNFFLGQGVWTPWQMLAWGLCGVVGGVAAPLLRGRVRPRGRMLRARPRVQLPDGRLGVVQLLPAHLAGAHRADEPRLPVQHGPRDRERDHRSCDRARAAPRDRALRAAGADRGRLGLTRRDLYSRA